MKIEDSIFKRLYFLQDSNKLRVIICKINISLVYVKYIGK